MRLNRFFNPNFDEARPLHLMFQMNVTEPTVIRNTAFSDSSGTGGPRVNIDYRMQLIRQRESAAPFLSFMLAMNSEATKTHQFGTFETRPNPGKALSAGAVAAGSGANATVTWAVATGKGSIFVPGTTVRPSISQPGTGETNVGIVVSISGDALTVRPNDPTKIICAITDADVIQDWGPSYAQGTTSPQVSGTVPTLKTFYTGISKHSYEVTKTHANNRLYGAPERDRLRGEREIDHLIALQKQLWYGDGIVDTTNDTHPRTTMSGIIGQITSNVFYYGSSLDLETLFSYMAVIHAPKYATDGNMNRRRVYASSNVLNDISLQILAKQMPGTAVTERQYGVDVMTVKWFNGRVWDFVEDPILSTYLPGWAIVMQPRYIKLREFRPTRLEANIQANDSDTFKDQFLTEFGLETQLEELHAVLRPGSAPA